MQYPDSADRYLSVERKLDRLSARYPSITLTLMVIYLAYM